MDHHRLPSDCVLEFPIVDVSISRESAYAIASLDPCHESSLDPLGLSFGQSSMSVQMPWHEDTQREGGVGAKVSGGTEVLTEVPPQGSQARAPCGYWPVPRHSLCPHLLSSRTVQSSTSHQSIIRLDHLLLRVDTQNKKGVVMTEGWFEVEERGEDHRIHPNRVFLFACAV